MTEPEKIDTQSLSFEESLKRLEGIVSLLESGRAELAVSLERYEEGVRLLRRCRALLDDAGRRIEIVKKLGDSGPVLTEQADILALQSDDAAPGRRTVRQKKSATGSKKSVPNEGNFAADDVKTIDADSTDTETTGAGGFFDFGEQ